MARISLRRLFVSSALLLAGLAGAGMPVASAQVQNRITAQVTGSYVSIPNSVHPKAKLGNDLGPAPADTKLGMSIRFNLTNAQQAALDQLLADQQNPSSPRYHQWLTPAQYAAQFGMSSADLAKVSAWLKAEGFTVTGVANGGTFISFNGTIAQAQTAFATSIHNVSVNGETHFANITNISVPSAFSGAVETVTGLHNFRLKPRVQASIVKPGFTSSLTGGHFVTPGDLYTIYNVNPLLNNSINGAGITIAVTGQVDIYTADVLAFRSASGLNTTNLPTTVHPGGVDPGDPSSMTCTSCVPNEGDLQESSIDVEWSGAMAPSANILFVSASCVLVGSGCGEDAMTYAIDNDVAPIVTTSYGLCEAGWGSTDLIAENLLFEQANVQGQTVTAVAADEGATDCDAGPSATEGLSVDFPGSSPNVTSMGGTQFNGDAEATGSGTTWAATQYWAGTSGTDVIASALSYIPEAAWNDEPTYDEFGGGGGGPSAFFTKPAWQIGTGVPADGSRDVPDLALDASDDHDSLLFCVNVALNDSCTNGFRIASGVDATDVNPAGGTSFDSQIFGGLLALVEQKIGGRIGNANRTIYALANSTAYYTAGQTTATLPSVVFNDVTTGNNSMPCTSGSVSCGNGGVIGFSAGPGYDLATGWGSVNAYNMANAWSSVTPLGAGSLAANVSTTSLTATPASVAAGATVTLVATVSGSSGAPPTGTVQFFANNVAVGSANLGPVSGSTTTATASYSWVTSCSALGQQDMSAAYSGDTNYQGSKGPILTADGGSLTNNNSVETSPLEVQITTNACPSFSIAASSSTVSVASGGTIPAVTITVTPVNGFTGTVSFTGTVTGSTSGYVPTLTFNPTSVTISGSAATTSLTLSGITASLHLPKAPGQVDSGTMLAKQRAGKTPWYFAGSGITFASLILIAVPRRRRLGGLLLVMLAVVLIGGATGCGSSQAGPPSSGGSNSSNPYAGTYQVNVIASYTGSIYDNLVTQQTTTVTYSIN